MEDESKTWKPQRKAEEIARERYICRAKKHCTLRLSPALFTMHQLNRSYYKRQEESVYWTVSCTFLQQEEELSHHFPEPVSEKTSIQDIIHIFEDKTRFFSTELNQFLSQHTAGDFAELRVYLRSQRKAEDPAPAPVPKSVPRASAFVLKRLERSKTIQEAINSETITDFPVFFCLFGEIDLAKHPKYSAYPLA